MNAAQEQQLLDTVSEMSRDMKVLLTLIKELALQQEKADARAFQQLSQIAHKR